MTTDKKCSEPDCDNWSYNGGTCPTHYYRELRGSQPRAELNNTPLPTCVVSHCSTTATTRQEGAFCREHHQVAYKGGDPEAKKFSPVEGVCEVRDCQKRASHRGVCHYHYKRIKEGRTPPPEGVSIPLNPECTFDPCTRLQESRGLCHTHAEQLRQGRELTPTREWGVYVKAKTTCVVPKCQGVNRSGGLCKSHLRGVRIYGLTVEETVSLFTDAECANPGCVNTSNLHIDHCHDSLKVRGLLCSGCNTSLGLLKEDTDRISGLIDYIEERK